MQPTQWMTEGFRTRRETDTYSSGYPFVTISREAGAGGHRLAETLLAQTETRNYSDFFRNWILLDEEICTVVMKDPDVHISMNELLSEQYDGPLLDLVHEVVGKRTSHYVVNKRISEFIKLAGRLGKVIIVGRGGSCVTRDLPGGIHVRLVAPVAVREVHMSNRFNVSLEEAKRMVRKQDHDRTRMVRDFFNRDIRDPALYDAVYDTDEVPIEQIARELMVRIEDKAHALHRV